MLSVKELARELSISNKTVYTLVERDEIPYYRIGCGKGILRFELEEVKRRLKSQAKPKAIEPLKRVEAKHLL